MSSRQVVLVCGPPCAGKTTYVERYRRQGDVVLDLDVLARKAGSPRLHAHAPQHLTMAREWYHRAALQVGETENVRAWVVRCAASPTERTRLAQMVRATHVVVLMPSVDVVSARARYTRTRRARTAIPRWYANYRPASCDTTGWTPVSDEDAAFDA